MSAHNDAKFVKIDAGWDLLSLQECSKLPLCLCHKNVRYSDWKERLSKVFVLRH